MIHSVALLIKHITTSHNNLLFSLFFTECEKKFISKTKMEYTKD